MSKKNRHIPPNIFLLTWFFRFFHFRSNAASMQAENILKPNNFEMLKALNKKCQKIK